MINFIGKNIKIIDYNYRDNCRAQLVLDETKNTLVTLTDNKETKTYLKSQIKFFVVEDNILVDGRQIKKSMKMRYKGRM